MELIAGDIIGGTVVDFGSDGEGIIKIGGYPVFVPLAIKGEEVRARVTYVRKDWAIGELEEVVKPSASRIKPRCPYFGKCGGCDLQHIDISEQLKIKRNAVKTALKKVAGISYDVPEPFHLDEWAYRNKLSLPFCYNVRSKRVSLGFFEKRSHKVVPIKWCPLHSEWAADMIGVVQDWANRYDVTVYDERTHEGLLRHAVARFLDNLSLTLVINGTEVKHLDELYAALLEKFDEPCVYISPNQTFNNVIFGDKVFLVRGNEKKQHVGDIEAYVSPASFLQVNNGVMDALYRDVAQNIVEDVDELLELYSGVGILTAELASRAPQIKITSVEVEASAVRDAKNLIKANGLDDRVNVVHADALEYMKAQKPNGKAGRALILDPPRRGCDKDVLEAAKELCFDKIVYISCNPQTLARDLKLLLPSYKLSYVRPYDMFPQTAAIETLAVLKRE